MRTEALSEHGNDMLREAERAVGRARFDEEVWRSRYDVAVTDLQDAGRRKSLWKRLLAKDTPGEVDARRRIVEARGELSRAGVRLARLQETVEQQAAGVEGENALVEALASLPDDWLMFRGYRNRSGETDSLLVGPHGLWAVEVKAYSVQLHVDGDKWWFERFDRSGKLVDTAWAVDARGRSWARQVNEVARSLENWLARNDRPVQVRTAVMLLHSRAGIGECRDAEVDVVGTDPDVLLDAIVAGEPKLDDGERSAIEALIRRDHRHHNRARAD